MIGWYCSSVKAEPFKHVVAALTGGFVGGLLPWLYLMPPRDSGQLAAWVQALGSILGIGVAVFIMRSQLKYQQDEQEKKSKEKENENKEILKRKVIFLCVAVNTLQLLLEEFNPNSLNRKVCGEQEDKLQKILKENRYKVWWTALQDIDLTQTGIVEIAPKIVNLRLQVKALIEMAECKNSEDGYYVVQAFLSDISKSLIDLSCRYNLGVTEQDTRPEVRTIDVVIPS